MRKAPFDLCRFRWSKSMKVAYVITKSEFGGAQEYLRILMSSMRQYDRLLITGDTGYLTETAARLDVPYQICKGLIHPVRPWQDFKAMINMYRLLRDEKPDLVHANSSKAGVIARVAALFAGVPAVFTAHGWAFTEGADRRGAEFYKWVERLSSFITRQIICVSDYDAALARRYDVVEGSQVMTVHNGIPDLPNCVSALDNEVPRIVMVARFAAPKDYQTLLHAAAMLGDLDFRLQCVGDGPLLEQCKALSSALGLSERVEFTGASGKVADILRAADIFALISRWEGFPISVLEGMRAGLPVVATRVGGIPEAVTDGVTGMLVAPNSHIELATALRRLIADDSLRKRMGGAGRERYLSHFTSERMIGETVGVYESIFARRRSAMLVQD
jgi:glycosyltransferase involved in cell wall biosynthesis